LSPRVKGISALLIIQLLLCGLSLTLFILALLVLLAGFIMDSLSGSTIDENLKEAKKETKHFFIAWLLFN